MINLITIGSALIKPLLIIILGGGLIGVFYFIALKSNKDNEVIIILEQLITSKRVYVGEVKAYVKFRDNLEKKIDMLYVPKFKKWYNVPKPKFFRHNKKGQLILQGVYDGVGGLFWVLPSNEKYQESLDTVEAIATDENGKEIYEEVIATDETGQPLELDKEGKPKITKVPKMIETKKLIKHKSYKDVLIESDIQSFFIEKGFEIHKTFENKDKWSAYKTMAVVGFVVVACLFAAVYTSKYMVDKTQETTFFMKGELEKLPNNHAQALIKKLDEYQKQGKDKSPENLEEVNVNG